MYTCPPLTTIFTRDEMLENKTMKITSSDKDDTSYTAQKIGSIEKGNSMKVGIISQNNNQKCRKDDIQKRAFLELTIINPNQL